MKQELQSYDCVFRSLVTRVNCCKCSDYCLEYLVALVLDNSNVDHTEYCRVAVGEHFKFRLVARGLDKLRKTCEVSSGFQFDVLNLIKQ